jgi:hypothetical protein
MQKNAHVAIAVGPDGVLKISASDKSFGGAAAYAFLCESQPRIPSMPYVVLWKLERRHAL